MQTSEITKTAAYRNQDERLGEPGVYAGADILRQIAIFGGDVEGSEDWDIVEADEYGYLMDYNTAEAIRPATDAEQLASIDAATRDGGAGVITVDGRRCYVQD
jgi:hypothetical protein